MTYEIQKACLIPLFPAANQYWHAEEELKSPTTEVWQTLDSAISLDEALLKLQKYRNFNKGRDFTYRIVEVIQEKPLVVVSEETGGKTS